MGAPSTVIVLRARSILLVVTDCRGTPRAPRTVETTLVRSRVQMGSTSLADALEALQPYVYGGLFLVALIQWRRRPGRSSLWLVATFGVLAAVVLAGLILPEDSSDPAVEWAGRALIAILVLFPYFLYRFTTTLLRPIPWVTVVGTVL